jgi:hypothetical protein
MPLCPHCRNVLKPEATECPECGGGRPAHPAAPPLDRTRCAWLTQGAQCLMRGTAIYGDGETRFCAWHDDLRTPRRAGLAENFDEFERWCLRLRARGYCGGRFEFAHADPAWLFALVTGDATVALTPPWRVGCAKTSCPYGWNGQRIQDAFHAEAATRPTPPAAADPPF